MLLPILRRHVDRAISFSLQPMRSRMDMVLPWRADTLLQQITVAVLSVGIALFIRFYLLDSLGMRLAYVTLFPAVSIAAALGGIYAGLAAIILSATVSSLWLAPLTDAADWEGLAAFLLGCLIVLVISEAMHSAQDRAAAAEADLRVANVRRESEARLDAVVQGAFDGIITASENGVIESANPAALRLFGYQRAEMVGMSLNFLMPEPFRSRHDEFLRQHSFSGVSRIIGRERPLDAMRKDGTVFPIELAVTKASYGERTILIGMVRDITERQEIEQALRQSQKLEAIGQLTGSIAHDFNNLLAVIISNTELLEMQIDDEKTTRLARKALEAAEMGRRLTDRLLSFARRQPLSVERVRINDVVDSLQEMLQRTVGPSIQLTTVLERALKPVHMDRGQLEASLINLVLNGRDAMPRGGRLVIETRLADIDRTATAAEVLQPGRYQLLSVSDSGSGMTKAVAERAFEPFFTTKPIGRGTGLGLAAVYGFAKQSGGLARIESVPGFGTTITLYLPDAQAEGETALATPSSETLPEQLKGLRVLVVEDDAMVREVVVHQLKVVGMHVEEASNAEDALSKFEKLARFQVLVTDLVMAGPLNGLELAARVSKMQPAVRIVLMSGFSEDLVVPDEIKQMRLPLLRKPFRRSELLAAIAKAHQSWPSDKGLT